MPVDLSFPNNLVSVTVPEGVEHGPVCISSDDSASTISFPVPTPTSPPVSLGIGTPGTEVQFPEDPPVQITDQTTVVVTFPSGGTLFIPRPAEGAHRVVKISGNVRVKVIHRIRDSDRPSPPTPD